MKHESQNETAGSGPHPNTKVPVVIDGKTYENNDRRLTGRQVLKFAGRHPLDEYLVYALGTDGVLEDLSLDEEVNLRAVREFRTYRNDRSFRFELEGTRQDWGAASCINETTLLKLAGVGNDYRVWMERKGQPDRMLERGEEVDLSEEGIEKFRVEKDKPDDHCGCGPKLVTITINGDPYEIPPGDHSVAEIRSVGHVPADEILNIFENDEFQPLQENQHIKIKGGEKFASGIPSGGAS